MGNNGERPVKPSRLGDKPQRNGEGVRKTRIFFRKNQVCAMMAFVMSDVGNPSVQNVYAAYWARARAPSTLALCFTGDRAKKEPFLPGGHDNPLKRLIPDKEIQGNQSFFSWKILLDLAWLGPILKNLDSAGKDGPLTDKAAAFPMAIPGKGA
jgi:hypothetical protein